MALYVKIEYKSYNLLLMLLFNTNVIDFSILSIHKLI